MDVGPAEGVVIDDLARRRLHEWRAAQEDAAVAAQDDRVVGEGGDVRAARGALAEDEGELRNAHLRQDRLVAEDPSCVVLVREELGLERQKPPALSQMWTTGSRFSIAMSRIRTFFLTVRDTRRRP